MATPPTNGSGKYSLKRARDVYTTMQTQKERQDAASGFSLELDDLIYTFKNRCVEPEIAENEIVSAMNAKLAVTLTDMSPSARVCIGPVMTSLHSRLQKEMIILMDALTNALATHDTINQLVESNRKRATLHEMCDCPEKKKEEDRKKENDIAGASEEKQSEAAFVTFGNL